MATNHISSEYVELLESSGYRVDRLLQDGGFGFVYQCKRSDTEELVAVKAIPDYLKDFGVREVDKLKKIKELNQDNNNLVTFNRDFEIDGNVFIEFEILDMTLYDFISQVNRPLYVSEIQLITKQMLEALNALKSIGLVHTDIKLDNIMLINHKLHPFKVKLIDFGLARYVSEMSADKNILPLIYKAPEVSLGLPVNEAVDMWALGCALAIIYLNSNISLEESQGQEMEDVLSDGEPDDHLLSVGPDTKNSFYKDNDSPYSSLEPQDSYYSESLSDNRLGNSLSAEQRSWSIKHFTSLRNSVEAHLLTSDGKDTLELSSILRQMLVVDPRKRITPSDALKHPFITMKDFPSDIIHLDDSSATPNHLC